MPRRFQLLAGHPVLDFANTLDFRYEPAKSIEMLESIGDLAQFGAESGLLSAAEARNLQRATQRRSSNALLHSARELRESFERIFAAVADGQRVPTAHLAVLNFWVKEASGHRQLGKEKDTFVWSWENSASGFDLFLWRIAQAAAELLTSPELSLVRRCDAANCRWLFLDRSKNHSRRWCDMQICGNREKARAYRHRVASKS